MSALDQAITYRHTPEGHVVLHANVPCIAGGRLHFHDGPPMVASAEQVEDLADGLRTCARRARESTADQKPSGRLTIPERIRMRLAQAFISMAVTVLPKPNCRPARVMARAMRDALDASSVEMRREIAQ